MLNNRVSRCLIAVLVLSLIGAADSGRLRSQEVDQSPLAIEPEEAFPNLRIPRPVVLTNAGDGSDRLFVGSQYGVIHVFRAARDDSETSVFLDISSRVVYKDRENEEGFLGMTFHPQYKENGRFVVYYTTASAPHTSVVSLFRVSEGDPNRADPDSEIEIMRIKQPYWNHNGGTVEFGPDGYLYVALGDGGAANDPLKAGQDLNNLLGSILRIDVDRRDEGKQYAIPKDNPFVGRDGARGEIWAYGLRNVWRMSFDRETGLLWAGDVGQDLWEEIDIIERGGNYGWNLREGKHKFKRSGSGPRRDLIEPIWEYHHRVGKSITGGNVYRGRRLPQLRGCYLYGDYVSGKLWALRYDHENKRVLANHPLRDNMVTMITFGEDEDGEVYFTTDMQGGVIYRFRRAR